MNPTDSQAFLIKICGLKNEADTTAAVAAGASAIGFNFYPKSLRFLTPAAARPLGALVPPQVAKVGVFVNPTAAEILRTLDAVALDVLQLHGSLPEFDSLPAGIRLWRATQVTAEFRLADLSTAFDAHLLDSPTPLFGGSGQSFDWRRARGAPVRVILAGGLRPSNVAQAIETAGPWGVDAASGLESEPGRKDPEKMKVFVEVARSAFLARANPESVSK